MCRPQHSADVGLMREYDEIGSCLGCDALTCALKPLINQVKFRAVFGC